MTYAQEILGDISVSTWMNNTLTEDVLTAESVPLTFSSHGRRLNNTRSSCQNEWWLQFSPEQRTSTTAEKRAPCPLLLYSTGLTKLAKGTSTGIVATRKNWSATLAKRKYAKWECRPINLPDPEYCVHYLCANEKFPVPSAMCSLQLPPSDSLKYLWPLAAAAWQRRTTLPKGAAIQQSRSAVDKRRQCSQQTESVSVFSRNWWPL